MYKNGMPKASTIRVNKATKGETIEQKMTRILSNKEPIKDTAQRIFTERKDGVLPQTNVRTDRFDLALDEIAAKVNRHKEKRGKKDDVAKLGEEAKKNGDIEKQGEKSKGDGGAEPIQGT